MSAGNLKEENVEDALETLVNIAITSKSRFLAEDDSLYL